MRVPLLLLTMMPLLLSGDIVGPEDTRDAHRHNPRDALQPPLLLLLEGAGHTGPRRPSPAALQDHSCAWSSRSAHAEEGSSRTTSS